MSSPTSDTDNLTDPHHMEGPSIPFMWAHKRNEHDSLERSSPREWGIDLSLEEPKPLARYTISCIANIWESILRVAISSFGYVKWLVNKRTQERSAA